MKKASVLSLFLILIIVTPVFAEPGKNNGKSEEHKKQVTQDVLADEVTPTDIPTLTPTITPTVTSIPKKALKQPVPGECDPNAEWKNHGQYVSCVAKQHLGGEMTSQAARSDIGKRNVASPSPTLSTTPTASPTATPTSSVSPPLTSPDNEITFASNPLENIKKLVGNIRRFFESLI